MDSINFIFAAGFLTYIAIRGYFENQAKRVASIEKRVDAVEIALLITVFVGCMAIPSVYLLTPWLQFADYSIPDAIRWFGIGVMIISLLLFWRCHSELGRNWSRSLEIRDGHQLVQSGLYRFIRHPMYLAIGLFCLAQAMILPNWLAGWSAIVSFAILFAVRLPREERMLCEAFGDEYRAYMNRTHRLIPTFGKKYQHTDERIQKEEQA